MPQTLYSSAFAEFFQESQSKQEYSFILNKKNMTTALRSFHNMKYRVKHSPSYKDCKICDEWQSFANFKTFYDSHYIENYELDKDLLGDGKLYSPKTCAFVPHKINTLLKTQRKDSFLPIGVFRNGKNFVALCQDYNGKLRYLGTFKTKEKAQRVYGAYKAAIVWDIATAYYNAGKISRKVYEAIITRKTIFY